MTRSTMVKILTAVAVAAIMYIVGMATYWVISGASEETRAVPAMPVVEPAREGDQARSTERNYTRLGDIIYEGEGLPYSYREHYNLSAMEGAFEILKGTRVVYTMPIYRLSGGIELSGEHGYTRNFGEPLQAMDITLDGSPDLILHQATGGMVLCCNTYVLSLGESVEEIASFESMYDYVELEDVDGDGKIEVLTKDWTLAREEGGWTGYPTAQVILEYERGEYRFSKRLMKRQLPGITDSDLSRFRDEIARTGKAPDELLNIVVMMIYGGGGDAALELFDSLFPDGAGIDYTDYILDNLYDSIYWTEIQEINRWDTPEAIERLGRYNVGC